MKELTTEQKAQRYDDAINAIKELKEKHPTALVIKDWIKENFPELKESEDEKIRKTISDILLIDSDEVREILSANSVLMQDIDTWLEKQGTPAKLSEEEQNRFAKGVLTSCAMSFIDYLDAHKYKGKMCVSNGECEDIENAFLNAMWDRLHRYYCKYIEEQGEQKEDATRYKIAEYLKKLILDQSQRGAPMFNYEGRIEEEVDFIINIAKKELKLEEQGEQKEATCVAEIIDRLSEKEQEILFKELNMQKEHNKFIKSIQIGDQVTRNQDGMLVNLSQLKRVAKPADKVKPKFHEGEWITNGDKIEQISKIDNYYRCFNGNHGYGVYVMDIKSTDTDYHLWTVKDAKDGDVLANDNHILILKEWGYNWSSNGIPYSVKAYCGIKSNGNFEIGKDNWSFCGTLHIHPATKEQRDTLEKAMADAGWEFDFDKKELKKIEQKPAWSEEDEKQARQIERIISNDGCTKKLQEQIHNWFESLKSRVQPQPKQGWSEEDEYCRHQLIVFCENCMVQDDGAKRCTHWLKSLRPKKQWKPTEEQINIIDMILTDYAIDANVKSILKELKELLKQL